MSDWRNRAMPVQIDPMEESRQAILASIQAGQGVNPNMTLPPSQAEVAPASDWRSRAAPVQAQTQTSDWRNRATPVEAEGFTDRLKQNFAKRAQEIKNIRQIGDAGLQTKPETLLQGTMATASQLFVDPVSEAVSTVTPEIVKQGIGKAINLVGRLPDGAGGTLNETVPEFLDLFSKQYPRATRNIKAVGQAVNLVGTTTGISAGAGLTRSAVNKASDAAFARSLVRDQAGRIAPGTAAEAAKIAGQNYDIAEYLGAKFPSGQVADKFEGAIQQAMPKRLPNGLLTTEGQKFANSLKEFQGITGRELTLGDVDNINQSLNQKISSHIDPRTGAPDADGMKLMQLQTTLRKLVDDVPDAPGADALINGRNAWRTKVMMKDLELVADRASVALNPASAMQAGYRALYNDKDRIAGWPKAAVKALKTAAAPGVTDEVLSAITSRLPSLIGLGTGNIAGAAGLQLGSIAARGVKESILAKRGVKVQEALGKDLISKLRDVNVPKPEYPETLQLAAPGKLSTLPMSDEQITIAQRLMNKNPAKGDDLSGSPTAPPVSQKMKLDENLKGIKSQEFKNLQLKLRNGKISQNKFIERVKNIGGLTEKQARNLAKEVLNYGENK